MSLFTDNDKEWKKATAKPRIPPPILRKDIFILNGVELKVQRPDTQGHNERGKPPDNKKIQDGRFDPLAKSPSSKSGAERDSSQRLHSRAPNGVPEPKNQGSGSQFQPLSSQTSVGSPDFMFAPDASDLANSCPTYGYGSIDGEPPSPTYVREPSPPAPWAVDTEMNKFRIHASDSEGEQQSPTYSYVSPPYVPPINNYIDDSAPPSPTYAPRHISSAAVASPVDSVDMALETPTIHVEWFEPFEVAFLSNFDMVRRGLRMEMVDMCDCLQDFKASPTADYDMLATRDLAKSIKEYKSFFDDKERTVMWDATQRSNKWELIGKKGNHIFMKRHAVQMAELDWLFNLTGRKYSNPVGPEPSSHDGLLYFADLCAGPGCFTEYIYWRRQKAARGWGFTLKGEQDFRIDKFNATSPAHKFRPCYGDPKEGSTGDITSSANIRHFAGVVESDTQGRGVVLVAADGDADESGEYLKQEWNMRRLVLCQAAAALLVLREGGNFVLKIFDVFTPFMHDLLYLVSSCFRKASIVKPQTSRPANSERFLVCLGLKQRSPLVAAYLLEVNAKFVETALRGAPEIVRLVSPDAVPSEWTLYVRRSNIHIGEAQVEALREAIRYCGDAQLSILELQTQVSAEVLGRWGVPSTVPASQDYLRNGRAPRASPWAAEKLLFKFDPQRDEPVKEKLRQPPPVEARDAAAAGASAVSPYAAAASKAEVAFGGGAEYAAGFARPPAAEAHGSSIEHAEAPGAADSVQAAAKPKRSTGPDLNDSAIKALLEKRAELARINEEKDLQAKAALAAKQKSSAAPPPGQGTTSKQPGKGGKAADGGAGGGKPGKPGRAPDAAHSTLGPDAAKAPKEHSASKAARKAGQEAEAVGGAGDDGQAKGSKEERKSKSKRGDEDEEERRRRHEKKAAKRRKRELEAQAGAQAGAPDAAAPSLKIRVKLSSSNPP